MLKTYWFVVYHERRYGSRNAGVAASSIEKGKKLLLKNSIMMNYAESLKRLKQKDEVEVIEDINVQLLAKDHVRPNMDPTIFKGVCSSRLNMYEEV